MLDVAGTLGRRLEIIDGTEGISASDFSGSLLFAERGTQRFAVEREHAIRHVLSAAGVDDLLIKAYCANFYCLQVEHHMIP